MFKRFLRIVLVLLGLGALYLAVLASEWLPRPREDQRQALALLQQPLQPVSGRSAHAVLWFLHHELDGADPDELMAQDVRLLSSLRGSDEAFRSVAADLPGTELSGAAACVGFPEPCLPEARDPGSRGATMLAEHGVLVERARALRGTGHFLYPFDFADPLQMPRNARVIGLQRFANARRFVSGDTEGGLSDACEDLSTWRRLRPTTNILIHHLMAVAFAQANAGLVSEMIAEWPADQPLPSSCQEALAPLAGSELDQCDAWRGEFAYMAANLERNLENPDMDLQAERRWPHWVDRLLVNQRNAQAIRAPGMAGGCTDTPAGPEPPPRIQDRVFDPLGEYVRKQVDNDDMRKYLNRHHDYLDVLRALRLQAWLRDQPDLAAAWAQPPADHLPLPDRLTLDPARRELSLELRRKLPDAPNRWLLLLPPPLPARPPAG